MTSNESSDDRYVHGHSPEEHERLRRQARFLEPLVYDRLPFRRQRRLLEVGSGVGGQTEILLRRFPELHVTGVEAGEAELVESRRYLATVPYAAGRHEMVAGDARRLPFDAGRFDAAFLCWVLEHVPDPAQALTEVRRVLAPGSPVACTEPLNSAFFLTPYSPHTMRYWAAFNDHQVELGGDPFVGAKLGNLLQAVGFRDVETEVRVTHLDSRAPAERAETVAYWADLLLSGAPGLLETKRVSRETVDGMTAELDRVARDPNSVFFDCFVQARARA
ncbi:MAG TPA: methyltransferase domain-containing protein [Polyangiaceae bacterium]|nr:methyltransferase domain-containing protein [Polyangiaceae bacterium]